MLWRSNNKHTNKQRDRQDTLTTYKPTSKQAIKQTNKKNL